MVHNLYPGTRFINCDNSYSWDQKQFSKFYTTLKMSSLVEVSLMSLFGSAFTMCAAYAFVIDIH